jgi:hypothetical protein
LWCFADIRIFTLSGAKRENTKVCDLDLDPELRDWGMMVDASLPNVLFTLVESLARDHLSLCANPISSDMVEYNRLE